MESTAQKIENKIRTFKRGKIFSLTTSWVWGLLIR